MNKVLRYFMMAVLACFFMVPGLKADAATITILPLVNKAPETDASMVRQIYYDKCINILKGQTEYTLVDNDRVDKIVLKHVKEGVLPTEQQLRAISQEADIDFVLSMELDEMYTKVLPSNKERTIQLNIRGNTVYYDRIKNKFTNHKIWTDTEMDEVFTSRWDPMMEEWQRTVAREINKAIKTKKLNLEAPRISKL